jgi:hypothetical protein
MLSIRTAKNSVGPCCIKSALIIFTSDDDIFYPKAYKLAALPSWFWSLQEGNDEQRQ